MPKISAPTVKEHRQRIQAALVDTAEQILRDEGPGALTAAAVTSAAGIARNSIYRYVDSVDDLRGLVLARHLPQWSAAVDTALAPVTDPVERIAVWARANLEQAARSGHGWLMAVARGIELPARQRHDLDHTHDRTTDVVRDALSELGRQHVDVTTELIRSMVDAGFRRLDAGDPPGEVIPVVTVAVRAVVAVG